MAGFYQDLHEVASGVVIYRRPGGKKPVWQYRIKLESGGYEVKSTKTDDRVKASAVALAAAQKTQERFIRQQPARGVPFSQVCDALLDDIAPWKKTNPKKYESYEIPIRLRFKPHFGKTPIDTIDRAAIREYYKVRRASGDPSASTLNAENSVLRAVFSKAVDLMAIKEYEIPSIENFSLEEQEPRAGFSEQEVDKLIATAAAKFADARRAARDRYRRRFRMAPDAPLYTNAAWINDPEAWHRYQLLGYVILLAGTGMRPKTARELKWGHVQTNPVTGFGLVFKGKTKKGKKTREWSIVPTEKASRRLDNMMRIKKHDPQDPIFTYSCFKTSFARLCKDAGVQYDVDGNKRTIYSLRHYYITQMVRASVRPDLVAKNTMTSVQMIAKYYDHNTTLAGSDDLANAMTPAQMATLRADMRR